MGGTKRKIPIEKRETRNQRSVAFSKRRRGLLKKVADLCLLCDARITVLTTPPSEKPNTFYSFGHSSVDDVIDAFLEDRVPNRTVGNDSVVLDDNESGDDVGKGLGFLREIEGFDDCGDPEKLKVVIERIQKLKENVMLKLNRKDNTSLSPDVHIVSSSSYLLTGDEKDISFDSCYSVSLDTNNGLDNCAVDDGFSLEDLEFAGFLDITQEDNFAEVLAALSDENYFFGRYVSSEPGF